MTSACLTVDLAAIAANYRLLAEKAAGRSLVVVFKAGAYGLGLEPIASSLQQVGCQRFCVATLNEGTRLRKVVAKAEIVVCGAVFAPHLADLVKHRLAPVLNHPGDLTAWATYDGRGRQAGWLHLDTGMNRLGFSAKDWAQLLAETPDWRRLGVERLMARHACADEPALPLNSCQRDAFLAAGRAAGLPTSLGNSSGIFLGEAFQGNLVSGQPRSGRYGALRLEPDPGLSEPDAPRYPLKGAGTASSCHRPRRHRRVRGDCDRTDGLVASDPCHRLGRRLSPSAFKQGHSVFRRGAGTDRRPPLDGQHCCRCNRSAEKLKNPAIGLRLSAPINSPMTWRTRPVPSAMKFRQALAIASPEPTGYLSIPPR